MVFIGDIEIIPGVIQDEWEPLKERLDLLKNKTDRVHIDVSDGVFTPHKTWINPADLGKVESPFKIEIHLMIVKPWERIADWIKPESVERIIVHWEALEGRFDEIAGAISKSGKKITLALNPETAPVDVEPFIGKVDAVLVMGVKPGFSGSSFEPAALEKIASLRGEHPNVTIEIDGGVNDKRAPEFVAAGANRLVSTSFIESFADPGDGIKALYESFR